MCYNGYGHGKAVRLLAQSTSTNTDTNMNKNNKKNKNKRHKLLIQVSAVVIPSFIIMIAAVLIMVYNSTVDSFLEAQNASMTEKLEEVSDSSLPLVEAYMIEYWEEHIDEMQQPQTDEERIAFEQCSPDEYQWSAEWFLRQSELAKSYCAKSYYQFMKDDFIFRMDMHNFRSIFLMDVGEKNTGMILYEETFDGEEHAPGDIVGLDLSEHKVLKDLNSDPTTEPVFERTENFLRDRSSYYIGYKLIDSSSNVTAVLGITYDWSVFQHSLDKTFIHTLVICIAFMLAAMVILSLMLFRRAIKPIERIQNGVNRYISSKDSSQVREDMAKISTGNELDTLSENITELADSIDRYTEENIRLTKEQERVSSELSLARNIQAGQLPSDFPAFPERKEFDIYASMTPAKEVGGDFYDFFLTDDDHLALVIADVSDKGMPAALYMMMTKLLINNLAMMGLPPHEVLERTNETLTHNNRQNMFVTVWLGILEISTGTVTASNAGHEYPIIKQPNGSFELFKDKHGFVAGSFSDTKYNDYRFTLEKGAVLFVFTDGVSEARNADREMFGTKRLLECMNRLTDAAPKELLEGVHDAVDSFVGDAPQFDDLTMLGLTMR